MNARRSLRAVAQAAALSSALVAGCADEERVLPVPAPPSARPDPTTEPPEPFPAPRTVLERNPFGNVAARENLLWDGDFEWASPFTDQYGWYEPPLNPVLSEVEIGPRCRSGVKCARVAGGKRIVGLAVAVTATDLRASVYAKWETQLGEGPLGCDSAEVILFSAADLRGEDPDVELAPEAELADEAGWCRYAVLAPARADKVYLSVRNRTQRLMFVDDAVILPSDGSVQFEARSFARPRPEAVRRRPELDGLRREVLALSRPAEGRPNPAREAFETRRPSR